MGFGGLEEAYVSKVTGRPFESVRAEAVEEAALFKSLVTTCECHTDWLIGTKSGFVQPAAPCEQVLGKGIMR